MDALDNKILRELIRNSRTPITILAKKVKASREVVNYRIEKLREQKIILEFITEINTEKLGFKIASLFLSINTTRESELIKYLKSCSFTAWTSEFSGVWNFGVGIYGKNTEEIHERFNIIYSKFGEDILDHRLSFHKNTNQFYEKYLEMTQTQQKKKDNLIKIDSKDKIILKELSKNSRLDCVTLSKITNLSAVAVANRIRHLEKSNIISKYSIFIDPSNIGLYQFSIFVKNNDLKNRDKLIAHLKSHPKVSFLVEYLGDPYIEFGLILKNPYDMRRVLQQIEETFPNTRVIETFMIQNEILSIGLPQCIFE
jgi:Lrp/AsnC family leucine-responsive transcriptional regulator